VRLTLAVESAVWGGAEAYVAGLLAELPAVVECTLLTAGPAPERLERAARERGAGLVRVDPAHGKVDVGGLRRLEQALRATRPDVLHLNQTEPTSNRHLLGVALARRVPVVPVLHLWSPLRPSLQRRVLRTAYARASRVIVVSKPLGAHAERDLGVPPSRVRVVRNGVAPAEPSPGSGSAVPVLVVVARLVPQKGLDVLVEAVRLLHDEGVALQVLVAGQGDLAGELAQSSQGLPLTWLGQVEDVPALLQRVDGLVMPSRDEGLPLALLEAMNAGLPCVATRVGDVPAALDGVGLLVAPDDAAGLAAALRQLLDDQGLRTRLGEQARARALERYGRAASAARTLEVYEEAAGG